MTTPIQRDGQYFQSAGGDGSQASPWLPSVSIPEQLPIAEASAGKPSSGPLPAISSATVLPKPAGATGLLLYVRTHVVYLTTDGSTPSATNGIDVIPGVLIWIPVGGLTVKLLQAASTATGWFIWTKSGG